MDKQQHEAFGIAQGGHNLLITGQAGSGKTFLLQQIVKESRDSGKRVFVTASTGIAATHLGGMTLHKWSGISDGRHHDEELIYLIKNDEKYFKQRNNICSCDLLIIDEISMISKKTLQQVEHICRDVRPKDGTSHGFFGGMQVILSGDFYQLPPVKDIIYGDYGHYAFQVKWFHEAFPHVVVLRNIHRQTDEKLISAVNSLARGYTDNETNTFMESLTKANFDITDSDTVHLFANNIDVDLYNYEQLSKATGQYHYRTSVDEGDQHYLKQCIAQHCLGLKVSSPVMLIANLSDDLVNGLLGTVTEIQSDIVYVEFSIGGKSVVTPIKRMTFSKYDPVDKKLLYRREQFPLKLAYALTIHKSQGMTLKKLHIDCKKANKPGQIGVALGRASSKEFIKIKNYRPTLIKPHPEPVNIFYEITGIGELIPSLECCVKKQMEVPHLSPKKHDEEACEDQDLPFDDDDDDHTSKAIDDLLKTIDHTYSISALDDTSTMILEEAMHDFKDTPMESKAEEFAQKMKSNLSSLIVHAVYRDQSKLSFENMGAMYIT